MHESNLLTDTVHSNPQLSHALFSCLIHSFIRSFIQLPTTFVIPSHCLVLLQSLHPPSRHKHTIDKL